MTVASQPKYVDPIQNSKIEEFRTEITGFCQIEGRNAGLKNRPETVGEYRAYIFNDVETKTQSQIDANHQLHTPASGIYLANKLKVEAEGKIHILQASINEDEHLLRNLFEKKRKFAPDLQKRRLRFWVYIAAAIISLAEGWFALESLRASGIPKVPAFFTALGIAVAIGFGSHFSATWIQKVKTNLQRISRYCFIIIPAFFGFYFLGNLRTDSYNQIVNLNSEVNMTTVHLGSTVSNWSITIISFLLFVTALLFSVYVHKKDTESKNDQEYDRVNGEVAKCVKRIKASKEAIATIQVQASTRVAEAVGRYEYAIAVENRLQSIAKEAIEVFKNANLRYRTDGLCPDFYSFPPSFQFRLFFNSVNTNHHEKPTSNYVA